VSGPGDLVDRTVVEIDDVRGEQPVPVEIDVRERAAAGDDVRAGVNADRALQHTPDHEIEVRTPRDRGDVGGRQRPGFPEFDVDHVGRVVSDDPNRVLWREHRLVGRDGNVDAAAALAGTGCSIRSIRTSRSASRSANRAVSFGVQP